MCSKFYVTPKWWVNDDDRGHNIYIEQGECICTKCGRRWDEGESDIPECEVSHSKVTPFGLNCIRELKKLFERNKSC